MDDESRPMEPETKLAPRESWCPPHRRHLRSAARVTAVKPGQVTEPDLVSGADVPSYGPS
jgi:hypothetical protein